MKRSFGRLGSVMGLALFTIACGDDGSAADDDESSSTGNADDSVTVTETDSNATLDSGDSSGSADDPSESGGETTDAETTAADSTGSGCGVTPPATWEAANWEANTTEALALRGSLDALVGHMRMAEQGMTAIEDVQELVDLYEAGTPSVSSIASPGYEAITLGSFAEFVDLSAAGPQDLIDEDGQWAPGAAGGIFGTSFRGINEGGLEVRQLVDKGLFAGGALYGHAASLTTGTIDEATIDSLAALWGANAMLDPEGEITDSANYTYQMGFHGEISEALIAAKAYAADEACEAERDEAIRTFFRTWELAMHARLVYYANVAVAAVEVGTIDDDFAGALHELGEGAGLALGFHGLAHPDAGPLAGEGHVVTDAHLESIATALGLDLTDLGASTTGEFVANYPAFADAVADVEDAVMEAFGLAAADIEGFREPVAG